jgi:hypothetical protein
MNLFTAFTSSSVATDSPPRYVNSDVRSVTLDLTSWLGSYNANWNNLSTSDFAVQGFTYTLPTIPPNHMGNIQITFTPTIFTSNWVGSIALAPDQNLYIHSGGGTSYPINPINFAADFNVPAVDFIREVTSRPAGFDTASFNPDANTKYFLVDFSEKVLHGDQSNNYEISQGTGTVSQVYSSTDTANINQQFLVKVNTTAGYGPVVLGIKEHPEVSDIVPLSTPPVLSSVDLYPGNQGGGTTGSEKWYKVEFANEVSKELFLNTGTFDSGSITLVQIPGTPPPTGAWPVIKQIAFQDNSGDFVDELFIQTNTVISLDSFSLNLAATMSRIEDLAGNAIEFDFDDQVFINDSTPAWNGTAASYINPPTLHGSDTLKIDLDGAVFVDSGEEYATHNLSGSFETFAFVGSKFDRYEIDAASVHFEGIGGASDVVALYRVGGNTLNLGSGEIGESETDIVDYSNFSSGINVTLGLGPQTTRVEASTNDTLFDTVRGAEGVKGGQGSNKITGNIQDNLLIGGNGTGKDELNGGAGNDILFGGSSLSTSTATKDILIGGAGRDVLIDFDGAVMTGHGPTAGEPPGVASTTGNPGPKDSFVVRTGSTITDYVLANNNAGLAGRAVGNINDIITFNIGLAELAVLVVAAAPGTDTESVMNEIYANFTYSVTRVGITNEWEIKASSFFMSETEQIITLSNLADVRVAASVLDGASLTVVELNNQNYFDNALIGDIFSPNIDPFVLDSLLPDIESSLNGEGSFNLSFALEATREGTVRAPKDGNLMFGDFAKDLRIFNPGYKSEVIFGSRRDDAYEFLVQDFDGGENQNNFFVGHDIIRDSGGDDNVVFSGVSLATIDTLTFEAVKIGREKGHYSLKTNYDQSENNIDNYGSFTWTGHFREGVDMQLETITLGTGNTKHELFLADNRYEYSSTGYLLSATPIQEAVEGRDTIMVEGVGRDGVSNRFKLTKNTSSSSTEQTDLYIWGIDNDIDTNGVITNSTNDLIDLSAFITKANATGAIADDKLVRQKSDEFDNPIQGKFEVDLNNNDAAYELTIHFMGSNVGQTTLEQMIMNAYTTST